MAMAGRRVEEEVLEIMPKGMLAIEKWLSAGMSSQEVIFADESMTMAEVAFVRVDIWVLFSRMYKDKMKEVEVCEDGGV